MTKLPVKTDFPVENNSNFPQAINILTMPLLDFGRDMWTVADACEGTQIFGGIGSGKTSGSGQAIAKSFLNNGFGGLVLTAKNDECDLWIKYCKETNREKDLIIFSPENWEKYSFNFMDYELNRSGRGSGHSANIVSLFYNILEVVNRNQSQGKNNEDPFWKNNVKLMLENSIDLLKVSKGTVSLPLIREFILSAPRSWQEYQSRDWQDNSLCFECLAIGQSVAKQDPSLQVNFQIVKDYWTKDFLSIPEKTRSTIEIMFTSMALGFLKDPMRQLFCGKTTVFPEDTQDGKIIVLDLPIQDFNEIGQYAQVLFKLVWQRAVERRKVDNVTLPVFLWADESQYFINSQDMTFQTTARSKRICTVYLTQNLPNYRGILGEDDTKSLLGNLATKIFHANSDEVTNEYASVLIGDRRFEKTSVSETNPKFSLVDIFTSDHAPPTPTSTKSRSIEIERDVLPNEFVTLEKGGYDNPFVDGIVLKTGRPWKTTRDHYMRVTFSQADGTISGTTFSCSNPTLLTNVMWWGIPYIVIYILLGSNSGGMCLGLLVTFFVNGLRIARCQKSGIAR